MDYKVLADKMRKPIQKIQNKTLSIIEDTKFNAEKLDN